MYRQPVHSHGSKGGVSHITISDIAPTLELAIAWRREDPSPIIKTLIGKSPDVS